jgi:hypothetical protein
VWMRARIIDPRARARNDNSTLTRRRASFVNTGPVLGPTARNVLSSRLGVNENGVGPLVEGDG